MAYAHYTAVRSFAFKYYMSSSMDLEIEKILSNITLKEFEDRFMLFENNQAQNNTACTAEAIIETIMIEHNGLKFSAFKSEEREYQKDAILYRVRKLEPEKIELTHDDFWEAPEKYVDYGRLNQPEQQLLYVAANNPMTAIKEVGIREGDYFLLTCYKVINSLKVFGIGVGNDFECKLSKESKSKLDALTDFIDRNFLKDTKSAYLVSSVIANSICDLGRDGWFYPSVAHQNGLNLCLKLSAKSNLEIHSSYICQLNDGEISNRFAITVGNDINIHHDWQSKSSKANKILESLFEHNRLHNELNKNEQPKVIKDIGYPIKFV